MLSDIEIAQKNVMEPISKIADKVGILPEELEQYGHYKAKISLDVLKRLEKKPDGKLVLVTAIGCGGPPGTLSGTCVRDQGRCCRRRLCPGGTHG